MSWEAVLSVLLAANLAGIVVNGRALVRLNRQARRNAEEIDDLAARLDGRPRNPFRVGEG